MVRPKYPKDALRAGTDTAVDLRVVVTPAGTTKQISGPGLDNQFGRATLMAVHKWRFHPVLVQNHPVETTYKIHVHFNALLQEAVTDFEVESPLPKRAYLAVSAPDHDLFDEPVHLRSEPGVTAPTVVRQVNPEYTEHARQEKENGVVTLTLIVGTNGDPRNIQVACSSVPDLNERAIESMQQWKFEPGTKDGKPVPVKIAVDTAFHSY